MGSIHACFDESKGQKDLNLTEKAIQHYNQVFLSLSIRSKTMKLTSQDVEQFSRLG